jgi:TPP-dependent pyruvate/acetoin dehydrogenase alpha subunit
MISTISETEAQVDRTAIDAVAATLLRNMVGSMLRIRVFEQRVAELVAAGDIRCPVHLYVGQEAIATGVCTALQTDDYVLSTHRSHGHYIAKGGDLNRLMAELYGKRTGCSHGRGGSMHLVDSAVGYVASVPIVAGTIPIAVGAALSAKLRKSGQVSVAFFGDGATDEGVFYESVNLAAVYKLPILFVCENNLFSTHMPVFKRLANVSISRTVSGFNMPAVRVDGNNVGAVYEESKRLIESIRSGSGPAFLECMTYRWLAHVGPTEDLDVGFRKKEDVEYWRDRCPIDAARSSLYERGALTQAGYQELIEAERNCVEESLRFALDSPYPQPQELHDGLYVS